jgi:transposase
MDRLRAGASVLQEGLALANELVAMIRRESTRSLAEWLAKAEQSSVTELRSLAASLRQDEAAVTAALTERWSNGPVEGHVSRLTMIKRQMYGRAGFRLLRARVLHPR